jgi:hypothetical protein
MKIFLFLIFSAYALSGLFSQTFRAGFDKRDASSSGGNGQGLSYHANVKSDVHNIETVYLKGYINMFQATHDKKYLDQFIIHAKRVQERRDDNITMLSFSEVSGFEAEFYEVTPPNPPLYVCSVFGLDQINTQSKGWSFVEDIRDDEGNPNCQYNAQAIVHSGEITYPMALFVWYMQSDPAFMALANEVVPIEAQTVLPSENCPTTVITTYQDFANWLECRIDETIDFHEDPTSLLHPNGAIPDWGWEYDNDLHVHRYFVENLNGQTSIGRTIALMYLITGDLWYAGRTTAIAELVDFWMQTGTVNINGVDKEFYWWLYGWGPGCIEDLGHAYLTMEFAEICYTNNIQHAIFGNDLFTLIDMERFSNTIAHVVYKNPTGTWNSILGVDNLESDDCGEGGIWAYPFLAKYNPYIYEMFVSYSGYNSLIGGTHLIECSELAKLQSPDFMNGENFKFNPVAVRNSPPVLGNDFYSATGDFNGDGSMDYTIAEVTPGHTSTFRFYNPSNCSDPNIGDCWFEIGSNIIPAVGWSGIAGGNFDQSTVPLDHNGDEIFALNPDGKIYYIENNSSSVNIESYNTTQIWRGISTNDFKPGHAGDEAVLITTSGDFYFAEYNNSGIELSSLVTPTGISDVVGITSGNFDNAEVDKQVAVLDLNQNFISIYSYDAGADEFLLQHQYTGFDSDVEWRSITSGDFDGDGIDEIVCFSANGGEMFVLKLKSTGLEIIHTEYFHQDQEVFSLASGSFGFSQTNEQLLVARNYDGRVTFYEIFGECPGLHINDVDITTLTSINNDLVFIQNDYPIDYHVNNTLTASDVTISHETFVNFSAGHAVVLKPGTTISSGATFHAYIDPGLACGDDIYLKNAQQGAHETSKGDLVSATENPIIEKPLLDFSAEIFPNPTDGNITVQLKGIVENQSTTITIYNSFGELVNQTTTNSARSTINLSDQANGIYVIKIQNEANVFVGRVVVQ